eukprot:COSAG02_NODE_1025_length_15146_cov_21.959460_6_plen_645_part_00
MSCAQYSTIQAGEIKKKLDKHEELRAKAERKNKEVELAHQQLVLKCLNEAAEKRIKFEGKLAKRSGVDGSKSPKQRMFLLVLTPPFDEEQGPNWELVPKITLEYYDSKWGVPKGIVYLDEQATITRGDGKTVQCSSGVSLLTAQLFCTAAVDRGAFRSACIHRCAETPFVCAQDRFTNSKTTGLQLDITETSAAANADGGDRAYYLNCPDEPTREGWFNALSEVITTAKKMAKASAKIQSAARAKKDREEFKAKLAAKKDAALGYTGAALTASAAAGATIYGAAAPKAQAAYEEAKKLAEASHKQLDAAVAEKYANEIFMEIDFGQARSANGIAYGQLVQWWAVTGGCEVSDEDIAAGKAIWEEKDTDGADDGKGLFLDDFVYVITKMQDQGLLDTAWAAVEKKAEAVGAQWGERAAASVTAGSAAMYAEGAPKVKGKMGAMSKKGKELGGGYLNKAKGAAAGVTGAVTGSAMYAKIQPLAADAYDEVKKKAEATHADLSAAAAKKYADEVFMEIDFSSARVDGRGLAYSQLVQWWAETGGVVPSDADIAAGKAIWETKDTDGADKGDGLMIEDFGVVFTEMQAKGLLDTAWGALEKKAKVVGTQWGERAGSTLAAGAAAAYNSDTAERAKAKGQGMVGGARSK